MSDLTNKSSGNVSPILRVAIFLVGVHSILLGSIIYFFTVPFYQFFFSVDPDNYFFIKQAGIFLFLMGFFYLLPVLGIERYKYVLFLVVFSKLVAVGFLLINANLAPSPFMIYLAALGDASMAIVITGLMVWYMRRTDNSK